MKREQVGEEDNTSEGGRDNRCVSKREQVSEGEITIELRRENR